MYRSIVGGVIPALATLDIIHASYLPSTDLSKDPLALSITSACAQLQDLFDYDCDNSDVSLVWMFPMLCTHCDGTSVLDTSSNP